MSADSKPATTSLAAGPLAGIRVLDMGTMMACPYGATLLGDLGADVIKVESHYGDESRHLGPKKEGERSPFLSLNRNKRGLVLDLQQPAAQEIFARLLKTTDVLIHNVREPALSKLGMAYEQVVKHRPDLIWVGVTAFGNDGPYAGRPGIDFLAQGYDALLAANGEPDRPPVRVTVPLIDTLTSVLVSNGVLAALHVRNTTGQGQRVDVCLLDALIHAQCSSLQYYFIAGEPPPRTGNRSQYFAPSGIYVCKDGRRIVITCPSEKFFRNLCQALERPWADEERFKNIDARLKNEDELDRVIGERCRDFDRDDLLRRLIDADMLTAPVNEVPDTVRDPQVLHNDMIVTAPHAKLGDMKVTGVPIKLRGTPGSVRRAAPLQGQHTEELLAELGYGAGETSRLIQDGTVATPTTIRRKGA